MSMTDTVVVRENGSDIRFKLNRDKIVMSMSESPAAMVERFRSQQWTFTDCMSIFLMSSSSEGTAFDYYQTKQRSGEPPARLGVVAGTILTAAFYGLDQADAVIDFDKDDIDGD